MSSHLSRDLLSQLDRYQTSNANEMRMLEAMKVFVRTYSNCFERSLTVGHVTGSAWIVDERGTSALLTHHRKLNRWLQPGGHWEGDITAFAIAKREAREESGLTSLSPLSTELFDIDVHRIPARHSEPEHLHYDARFIFKADANEAFTVSHESRDLAWMSMREIADMGDPSLTRMVEKTGFFVTVRP
jgi:8-oxo-dGTP pyrophosphatase MutT (NUDIX family)